MGGKEYAVTELAAIEAASACQTQEGGFRQLLNPAMYKVLTIGVVMAILQQWCGINVIFNYAQEIFMAAGYGVSDVLMNIVVTGITNVIFTIFYIYVENEPFRLRINRVSAIFRMKNGKWKSGRDINKN